MEKMWRQINDIPHLRVSSEGEIYSEKNKRFLKIRLTGTKKAQYNTVFHNGKNYKVHRLVAQSFVPNPQNKKCINHIDGNKLNNNSSNLEWVNHAENLRHAALTGLMKKGTDRIHTKLNDEDVSQIKQLHSKGVTQTAIAKMYNVNQSVISRITNFLTRKTYNYANY